MYILYKLKYILHNIIYILLFTNIDWIYIMKNNINDIIMYIWYIMYNVIYCIY